MSASELELLLDHMERFRAVTLQCLDLVPRERIDWRPEAISRSLGQQFIHIARTEDFYFNVLFEDRWEPDPLVVPADPLTVESVAAELDEERARALLHLRSVQPGDLARKLQVPGIPAAWPVRSWLWYLVEHEVHHKAQIAAFLRQIGIEPPFFALPLPLGVRPDTKPEGAE